MTRIDRYIALRILRGIITAFVIVTAIIMLVDFVEATRNIGMKPTSYRSGGAGEVITYACKDTSLGLMAMAATPRGVCFVQFGENEKALLQMLKDEFPKADLIPSPAQSATELDNWIEALDQHISKGTARPDLPLDMRGTAFQMQV